MRQSIGKHIVRVHGDDRVFAKLVSVEANQATVEFFHSIADRRTEIVDLDEISRIELQRQTRVFVEVSPGYWRVGRVWAHLNQDDSPTLYDVRFPNKSEVEISETNLFVRCLDAYADPSETLAEGLSESQLLADNRRLAMHTLRELWSSCEGLTGIYSSAIDLLPHQIANIRKITQDNQIRYLLADEVGLGKTIEAGCVVRQLMLDNPDFETLVLTPSNLVGQWRNEFAKRFYIEPDHPNVTIENYNFVEGMQLTPDLLIIDEAHGVIGDDNPEVKSRNAIIEKMAHEVKSVLLLSATPALGDEVRLQGLLHLLDPISNPKDDLENFKKKVENRQDIGRLLLSLQPGGTSFVIKSQAKNAKEMFPDDELICELVQTIIESDHDEDLRANTTLMLRDYIARTYRIHERLLRSRRKDAQQWALRPRGPDWPNLSHVQIVPSEDNWVSVLSEDLENWRIVSQSSSIDQSLLSQRWRYLIETTFLGRKTFAARIGSLQPLFEGEAPILEKLASSTNFGFDTDARSRSIINELSRWKQKSSRYEQRNISPKIVCFTSSKQDAEEVFHALEKHFGPYDVYALWNVDEPDLKQARIDEFKRDSQAWVLVCDRSAEEGLNLQFVQTIFHLDLPGDVGRLEQRIGRLDRFGRSLPQVGHLLLLPDNDEDADWYRWMALLFNGFRVFNQSISDVQLQISSITDYAWSVLFQGTAKEIDDFAEEIAVRVSDERQKLNEQAAIDAIANIDNSAVDLMQRMEDAEADEALLNTTIYDWFNVNLKLSQMPARPAKLKDHKLYWDDPLIPKTPWKAVLEPSLRRSLTWQRESAQRLGGRPILLRPGSQLLDALDRISRWDDRGTCYATLRVDRSVEDLWIGFRWVWVLNPGMEKNNAVWKENERPDLYRRVLSYLPPITIDFWTDINGEFVPAEKQLLLARPYKSQSVNGSQDFNLGSRPQIFAQLFERSVFKETLRTLRKIVEQKAWRHELTTAALDDANRRFNREQIILRQSLKKRREHFFDIDPNKISEIESQIADLDEISSFIANPKLRLDECGMVALTPELPDA